METVEEFMARGGQVEKVTEPPRAEKCSQPFGAAAASSKMLHVVPDLSRNGGHRRMRNTGGHR